jgi:FkbM family methyltransferase
MIKILRSKPIINKPVRSLLKGLVIQMPGNLTNYFAQKWRIAGQVEIELDNVKFNFFSNCDDGIVDPLYYYPNNYSEINELKLFAKLAVRSKFILDIGANTGIYSVLSSVTNRNCEIWAFEPYPSNFNRLKLNLSLNKIDNVVLMSKAIGDEGKTINISVPDNGQICDTVSANSEFSNRFYKEFITYKEIEVEQVKLDEIVPHDKKVDLIKIDVESYEIPVLKGAREILEIMSPVIQCEVFVEETRTEFYAQVLKPLGYNCYMMLKNGLAFTESLKPNTEGRDFLFTKQKLANDFTPYQDASLAIQLIP